MSNIFTQVGISFKLINGINGIHILGRPLLRRHALSELIRPFNGSEIRYNKVTQNLYNLCFQLTNIYGLVYLVNERNVSPPNE